jgi:hypothetical protein
MNSQRVDSMWKDVMLFWGSLIGREIDQIKVRVLGVFIFLIFSIAPAMCLAEDVSFFAGSDIDGHGQGFSYTGLDMTHPISQSVGLSGQIVPSYLTYKYETGGREIEAKAPGVSLVGGVKYYWEKSMIALFGGGQFRNINLSPDDPNSNNRGNTTSTLIQGECSTWLTNAINLYSMASYSFRDDFVYEKLKVKWPILNKAADKPYTFYLGMEQFLGRNVDYQGEGVGVVLELFHSVRKFSIAIKSGYKHDSNFGNSSYGGLELYKGF